jgi:hypothetical protein
MQQPEKTSERVLVSCAVCLRDIPYDESSVVEVDDYVMYFCGLECFQVWRKTRRTPDTQSE